MYFDSKPCQVCGSEVRLEARDQVEPRDEVDADATVDRRVCTNGDCATNRDDDAETPEP